MTDPPAPPRVPLLAHRVRDGHWPTAAERRARVPAPRTTEAGAPDEARDRLLEALMAGADPCRARYLPAALGQVSPPLGAPVRPRTGD